MKKLSLLIGMLLLTAIAYAQVKVNPKVGLNFSALTADGEIIESDGLRVGYNAGLDFRIGESENWFYFQPGLHYYSVGAKLVINNNNPAEVRDIIAINSLKLPMDGGLYLTGTDGALRVRVNAGLVPTILMSVEDNDLFLGKEDFKTFGLGFNAGLGLDLTILTLDFNYEAGITEVFEAGAARNNIFSISAGLVF